MHLPLRKCIVRYFTPSMILPCGEYFSKVTVLGEWQHGILLGEEWELVQGAAIHLSELWVQGRRVGAQGEGRVVTHVLQTLADAHERRAALSHQPQQHRLRRALKEYSYTSVNDGRRLPIRFN